ncbi:MAG: hypothetical protein KDA84_14730 [Planctomycetaceae bacterium]|nr:hypothetical protein [Planctomycetaceae bacterium]
MTTFSSRFFTWLRCSLVWCFVLIYLATGALYCYRHLLGDTTQSAFGYFWTWDMFPNYPSFSARRFALGQTRSGRFVRVFPTEQVRFRRGGNGNFTRFDLPRKDAALRIAVANTLELYPPETARDPITYVFLVEEYWPVRFNLPDDLYQDAYGDENPNRHSWRILDEGRVERNGDIHWTSTK